MESKSRMLLPRWEETLENEPDPRQGLVRQLLEYKKFEDAALHLEQIAHEQARRLSRRGNETLPNGSGEASLREVELWDLVSSFGRLMRETLALEPQKIIVDQTPIYVHMEAIVARLSHGGPVAFTRIFTPPFHKSRLVGLFLALLELVRECRIQVEQDEVFGEILLRLCSPSELRLAGRIEG